MCVHFWQGLSVFFWVMGSMFGKPNEESRLQVEAFVNKEIQENRVMVFSKSYCPYCKMAKKALADAGATFKVAELDKHGDESAIQGYLATLTGASTVPRVFINGKFIGGGTETQALQRSGELAKLVSASS